MEILDKVLTMQEFIDEPPVLMDIGAALHLHAKWKSIAKYSICIAFDADERHMEYEHEEVNNYQKLHIVDKIVTDQEGEQGDFYLTKYPSCSSFLKPDKERLRDWSFGNLFEVEKVVQLKTTTLRAALDKLNLNRIDWFKVDAQGADLRLFDSLGSSIINKILMAEFEPGILDAYLNEDKLCVLMQYMEKLPFWMADIVVKGSQRVCRDVMDKKLNESERGKIAKLLKTSPGYAEVTYLNSFKEDNELGKRDFLLGWVFSILEEQYGFAIEIAMKGSKKFNDPIFQELEEHSVTMLKNNVVADRNNSKSFINTIADNVYTMLKGS